MKKEKKPKFEDDGRTIANMNVEGMPWYSPGRTGGDRGKPEELSPAEKRAMTGGVLAAALLITLIFVVVFFLFIVFCTKVWLV